MTGIVVGGIIDKDLIEFLGYDIGVAITGHENISLTLVITEGFGTIAMARRTFELLRSLAGRSASINGATQIRAGVIRPEVIVPLGASSGSPAASGDEGNLSIGTPIRIIREPYFGKLASVSSLRRSSRSSAPGHPSAYWKQSSPTARSSPSPANVEIIETS